MQTKESYTIDFVHLAYIPPFPKDKIAQKIKTEIIKVEDKTTEYLFEIFDSSVHDAKVEIIFNGQDIKFNAVRNHILNIVKTVDKEKIKHTKSLCTALYEQTDSRNGNGLFVVMHGSKGISTRTVLMRFKGAEGLVSKGSKSLVGYMSEVFTKRSTSYKLAVYQDIISEGSYWKGFSVDKQISGASHKPISMFWIEDFLQSRLALTSAQGTLQFSKVVKDVLSQAIGLEDQEQLISALIHLRTKSNFQTSLASFCTTYLSQDLAERIRKATTPDFFEAVFPIDKEVYGKQLGKTVLSMDGGIIAFIPTFSYDKHVEETVNIDGSKTITIESKLNSKNINVQPGKALQ